MKKVLFVLVALLLVSTYCFALESGPSNKVGYVKLTCGVGNTPFGLPFKFWVVPLGNVPTYGTESRRPSSIIGAQANCGNSSTADRVTQQGSGYYSFRNTTSACAWINTLENADTLMMPGKGYYYNNKSGAARTIVLAGEADITAVGIPTVTISAPATATGTSNTAYSWRDPRDLRRDSLNLRTAGFLGGQTSSISDRVTEQGTGAFFWLNTSNAWQGTLQRITPGKGYYIANKHQGHVWTYRYNASYQAITDPQSPAITRDTVPVSKEIAPSAVTQPVKNSTTADTKRSTSTSTKR